MAHLPRKIIQQDDPVTRRIDGECQSMVMGLTAEMNFDPVSVVTAALTLMARQCAMVDIPMTADLLRAMADEVAANYDDNGARQRRLDLTTALSYEARQRGEELARGIVDGAKRRAGQ